MATIRRFKKSDAVKAASIIRKALIEINSKSYPESVIKYMYDVFTPEKMVELSKERDFLVATEQDVILGTATLKNDHVGNVFVDPKHHGKGMGTKLMNAIESLARERGITKLILNASIDAIKFYQKLNYEKVSKVYNENYGITFEMTKEI